jgi:hypothetical protein
VIKPRALLSIWCGRDCKALLGTVERNAETRNYEFVPAPDDVQFKRLQRRNAESSTPAPEWIEMPGDKKIRARAGVGIRVPDRIPFLNDGKDHAFRVKCTCGSGYVWESRLRDELAAKVRNISA